MRVGLGPAKGKDFATSLGPVVVTPDEFDGSEGEMIARVNGEERSRGNLRAMHHPWDALRRSAARNTILRPGDLIGSGTVGTGSSSSTATVAGCSAATWSSSRSKASAVAESRHVITVDDVRVRPACSKASLTEHR